LVTKVLTKALSLCVVEIIMAWKEFPAQEHWLPDTSRPLQQGRGMHLPWGKGILSTSPGWNYPGRAPRLLEIRPPETPGVTIEDTEMENCLGKEKFTSAEGCPGTWAQQA
jgi:hypothetical protein